MSGGAVLTYRGSWCAEGLNTTWEGDWRIGCERGAVRWDGAGAIRAQKVVQTGGFHSAWADVEVPAANEPDKTGGHGGCIAEFVRCVSEEGTPETIASDNLKSLAMVFGAIESASSGRRVTL